MGAGVGVGWGGQPIMAGSCGEEGGGGARGSR